MDSITDHEMLPRNSPKLAAVKLENHVESEENNDKVEVGEMDSGFNETIESEENTSSIKENGHNNDEELEEGEIQVISKIEENSVSHGGKLAAVNDEPPKKKFRGCREKFHLRITSAPLSTEPEAVKQTLEEVIGVGEVSIVGQSWKLQPASRTFINIFYAEVFDRETMKYLVKLKPKLCIDNDELMIEENKTNRTNVSRKETCMVFISQIPLDVGDRGVIQSALEARVGRGNVISVICLTGRKSGLFRGHATVSCANELTAKRLLLLDSKIKISGRRISIVEYEGPSMRKENRKANKVIKLAFRNLPTPLVDEFFRGKIMKLVGSVGFLEIELPLVKNRSESEDCAYIVNLRNKEVASKLVALHRKVSLAGKSMSIRIHVESKLHFSELSCAQGGRTNRSIQHSEQKRMDASVDHTRRASLTSSCCSGSRSVMSQDGRTIIDYAVEQFAHKLGEGGYENIQNGTNGTSSRADYFNDVSSCGCKQKNCKSADSNNNSSNDWNRQGHDNIYEGWRQKAYNCAHIGGNQGQNHQGADNLSRVGRRPRACENVNHGQNNQGHDNFSEPGSYENAYYNNGSRSNGQSSNHVSCHNYSGNGSVNHGQSHQNLDNFGRLIQRPRTHGSVQGSNDFGTASQHHLYHNHNNSSRVGMRQNVNSSIGFVNVSQNWNRQNNDNLSRSRRHRSNEYMSTSIDFSTVYHNNYDCEGLGNVNRVAWAQPGFESVHGTNNYDNVDQSAWEGQDNYDWSDGFQYEEGYNFE